MENQLWEATQRLYIWKDIDIGLDIDIDMNMNINLDIDIKYRYKGMLRKKNASNHLSQPPKLVSMMAMNSMGSRLPLKTHTKKTDPSPVIFAQICQCCALNSWTQSSILFNMYLLKKVQPEPG